MRLRRAAASFAVLGLLLAGCSASSEPLSATAGPTASAEPAVGASLSPTDFAAAAKRPDTVLLDVRTQAEYDQGHLPNSTLADVESADFAQVVAGLDPSKSYAIYCRSGNRSKVAMTAMQQLGFTKLYDLDGGITAWQSAGGEVVQ